MDTVFSKIMYSRGFSKFMEKTAPRWIVLLIDLAIVLFSFGLLTISDELAGVGRLAPLEFTRNACVILGTYLASFIVFRSYASVIRLSVLEDLYREMMVVLTATIVLLVINTLSMLIANVEMYRYSHVIIGGFICFSFFVIGRLCIKGVYTRLTHVDTTRRRVLILGTSIDSLILANALKSEIGGKYCPVGLLAEKGSDAQGTINGFKVYPFDEEQLPSTFAENSIHALIFGHKQLKDVSKNYADFFIAHNLKLLSLNTIKEFEGEEADNKQEASISTRVQEVQIEDLLGREPIVLNNTLVRNHIRGSVVMITGACGSIGSEIVRQVASYKAKLIVLLDQAETPMHDLSLEMKAKFPNIDVVTFMGDVQNYVRMEKAFATYRPKYVFHAAAYKHVPMMEINPSEAVLTNVMGTKNVADLSLKYGVHKFVMISTDKAVNPSNIMGCTKRLAEVYTQSLFFDAREKGGKTQFITTRFGNVLGSNGSVIPLFRKQIAEGGPVTLTHRDIIRYFMTIPEACSLVLEAGCMGHGGEIYVFDMGEPVKIYDLAARMISLAGLRVGKDIEIKEVGLRPGEKLYEELLNDKEKTLDTTENEKIMVAKVRTYNFPDVADHIDNIVQFADQGNVHDMVKAMKRFIPEFHSNMSEFEEIDKEIQAEANGSAPANKPETEVYY